MMTKPKKAGWLWCKIVDVKPLWLDVQMLTSGETATVFFMKGIPPERNLFHYRKLMEWKWRTGIFAEKMREGEYKFIKSGKFAMTNTFKAFKARATREALWRTLDEDHNPARAKHSKSAFGHIRHAEFLMETSHTGNKLSRTLARAVGQEKITVKKTKGKNEIKAEKRVKTSAKLSNAAKEPWSDERYNSYIKKIKQYHKKKKNVISQDIII